MSAEPRVDNRTGEIERGLTRRDIDAAWAELVRQECHVANLRDAVAETGDALTAVEKQLKRKGLESSDLRYLEREAAILRERQAAQEVALREAEEVTAGLRSAIEVTGGMKAGSCARAIRLWEAEAEARGARKAVAYREWQELGRLEKSATKSREGLEEWVDSWLVRHGKDSLSGDGVEVKRVLTTALDIALVGEETPEKRLALLDAEAASLEVTVTLRSRAQVEALQEALKGAGLPLPEVSLQLDTKRIGREYRDNGRAVPEALAGLVTVSDVHRIKVT